MFKKKANQSQYFNVPIKVFAPNCYTCLWNKSRETEGNICFAQGCKPMVDVYGSDQCLDLNCEDMKVIDEIREEQKKYYPIFKIQETKCQ